MMKKIRKEKKAVRFILPMFAVGALVASSLPSTPVQAEDNTNQNVYTITVSQGNLYGNLKEQVIENIANTDENVSLETIDFDKSTLEVNGLNTNTTGIQAVTLKVNLVTNDASTNSVGYSYIEEATVNTKIDQAPRLVLKSDSVTVNNGDNFNAESYITYINDDSTALPALKIDSNVDMSTDGEYLVTYKAIDLQGNTTEEQLQVTVATPQEVLDAIAAAEAEAQRVAEEEAARQAAEEAAAAAEAQRIAQEQAIAAAIAAGTFTEGSSELGNSIASAGVSYAGSAYVMGGTSPLTGFDCSGFTQYVYSLYGISLPRTAEAQAFCGTTISLAEAQPGDLVTYSGHAAIYIGNGQIINALNPSMGVQVTSVYLTNGNMQVHRLW